MGSLSVQELRAGAGGSRLFIVGDFGRRGIPGIRWGAVGLGVVAAVAGAGGTGCGPSFQAVYECDVRFEHCYALDQQPIGVDAQKACWREWLHNYTYGQSRDRVEYAAARFSELSLDPTLPSVDTPTHVHRPQNNAAPLPTSAFAPPPNLAGESTPALAATTPPPATAAATSPRAVAAAAHAPGEQCTIACAERWSGCRKDCKDGACDACDGSYRACVPACFADARRAPHALR
ncbi:MAG TPA: hypothetical protein VIF09_08310 [Polyangiaceae bacterium]|jgi:hypothetical protein